jgi:serine O-acetyltransferase
MQRLTLLLAFFLNSIRCIPHILLFYLHKNRKLIRADIHRWMHLMNKEYSAPIGFIYLMGFCEQFRNLFYYRVGSNNFFLNILCPKMPTLLLAAGSIGEGLFLPHGFATAIGAKSIGKNCSINHNVTIGTYGDENRPTILDNVTINAGTIIFGKITVGNNVVIGANSTVNTDVPDNSTVFPSPSRIIKWNKQDIDPDKTKNNNV